MIILGILLFLSATHSQLYQGESCTMGNGSRGVCVELRDCELAKQQIKIGKMPDKLCGYSGLEPIVCCSLQKTSPNLTENKVGAISRQKCAEYSKLVWTMRKVPFLISNNRQAVNVSQCSIPANLFIGDQTRVIRKEFPHMAAVGYELKTGEIGWHCSGTLISETFVLTAAHCTFLRDFGNATWVRVGDLDLVRTDDDATPEDRRIIERIKHPQFKLPSPNHDIALLRLESRVPFNKWIRPACLNTASVLRVERAFVVGWSVQPDSAKNEGWSEMKKFILSLIDSKTCNTRWTSGGVKYKLPNKVDEDLSICAGGNDARRCLDANGEPLVIYGDNFCMYDVVGIASIENYCYTDVPAIFTRVYHYIPWIESMVWPQG